MNLEKETGPVYPKAEITITYVQSRYGYVIKTNHPKFGPVEHKDTVRLNLSEEQAILSAKNSIGWKIHFMEKSSQYPKTLEVDLSKPEETKTSWFARLFK